MQTWPVAEMAVSDLAAAAWPENPRVISKAARARLKASLEEFGVAGSLVWNSRSGRLVSGHQRISLLSDAGVDKVSVTVVDLPEDQEQALNVSLNRADLMGDWDHTRLDSLLAELAAGSEDLLSTLRLEEMPEFRAADSDRLLEKILAEKEYVPDAQGEQVDPADIAERLAAKIRAIPPARLRNAQLVAVTAGSRAVMVLANDPSLEDFASEVRHAAESGSPSPLSEFFSRFV